MLKVCDFSGPVKAVPKLGRRSVGKLDVCVQCCNSLNQLLCLDVEIILVHCIDSPFGQSGFSLIQLCFCFLFYAVTV